MKHHACCRGKACLEDRSGGGQELESTGCWASCIAHCRGSAPVALHLEGLAAQAAQLHQLALQFAHLASVA